MTRGLQNKAGVMKFADAMDDFFVGIRRGVGVLLSRQRKNHPGVIAPRSRELVSLLARAELEPRPLAPQIDAGGRFDHIGDVSASDPGGNLDKIELSIGMGLKKIPMSYAAHQTQAYD